MTQADRVLAAARFYRGTCQADWLADETPDGGPWITRVAARIQDLEDAGHEFECIGVRNKTKIYRLAGVSSLASPAKGTAEGAQRDGGRLREAYPPSPRSTVVPSSCEGRLFELPAEPHWRAA